MKLKNLLKQQASDKEIAFPAAWTFHRDLYFNVQRT